MTKTIIELECLIHSISMRHFMTTYFAQALQKNKTKTLFTNLNKCLVCESTFVDNEGHGKFCSKACSFKIEKNCLTCNKKIFVSKKSDKFCSSVCQKKNDRMKVNEKRKAEGGVQCLICGDYGKTLALHLKKLHNISAEDYRNQYGGKTICESTSAKFSEQLSGENNPWYNHGGTISPFSKNNKKFIGLSEEEKQQKVDEAVDAYIKTTPKENRPMNVEYWTSRGMTDEEAKAQVSKRQTTFSLEKCIERYGEEAGRARWQERQEKWQANLNSKPEDEITRINKAKMSGRSGSRSGASARLFQHLPGDLWGPNEVQIKGPTKRYLLDYIYENKCIEFNGDYWHANPLKYKAEQIVGSVAHKVRTAEDIWEMDRVKHEAIKNAGYELLIIWEFDFYKDPEGTIQKCKDFLKT